ncbi:hypothetical protein EDD80_106117 [Anseongella ginsenosidimutans]|uniref:Uncharacterized protein n=1 Tax=Anseongella ginsenosidimutans TaxID=496056 RepID=A0A4R3KPZ2_9SPHI|nr:hypothetical protein EDD80_106117 [Anseongella ginsenosidimutans]
MGKVGWEAPRALACPQRAMLILRNGESPERDRAGQCPRRRARMPRGDVDSPNGETGRANAPAPRANAAPYEHPDSANDLQSLKSPRKLLKRYFRQLRLVLGINKPVLSKQKILLRFPQLQLRYIP